MTRRWLLAAWVVLAAPVVFAGGRPEDAAVEPVRVLGAYSALEASRFLDATEGFADAPAGVTFQASHDILSDVRVFAAAGTEPDIVVTTLPAILRRLVAEDHAVALPASVDRAVRENYGETWRDAGSVDDALYAVAYRVRPHSVVWYDRWYFAQEQYMIPGTWDELTALGERAQLPAFISVGLGPSSVPGIVVDGGREREMMGLSTGADAALIGTVLDWLSDILLREVGPEFYDRWIAGEQPFDAPEVIAAANRLLRIGVDGRSLQTPPEDAIWALFTEPPQALLHRQQQWVLAYLQERVRTVAEDRIGAFVLPEIDERFGSPVTGGADLFAMITEREASSAFLSYLTEWEAARGWAAAGGASFPHRGQDYSAYASRVDAEMARIATEADLFRFSASLEIPPQRVEDAFAGGLQAALRDLSAAQILAVMEDRL